MLFAILRVALQDCFVVLAAVEHGDDRNLLSVCVEGDHKIRKYSPTKLLSFFVTVS